MQHEASGEDLQFRRRFEACEVGADEFGHRAHVRLAYVYLTEPGADAAHTAMRASLKRFIEHVGGDPSKYHETLTRAWIMAVRHFMTATPACASADAFIDRNPRLLDARIMLSHYSDEVLFSEPARGGFVEPDIAPIPGA